MKLNSTFKVMQDRCDQCLFSKDKIVSDERRREVLDSCMERGRETFFVCHKTKSVCCKGFYDSVYAIKVAAIQVADRLNLVEFVTVDSEGEPVSVKSVTAKSGAGARTCVCKKKLQFLSPGYTQNGKPCYYCAACIPF